MNLLEGKTVILGATGGSDRHSLVVDMVMRPLFAYMRASIVPTGIYATSNDWGNTELSQRIKQAAKEAFNAGRVTHFKKDVAMNTATFEEMLSSIQPVRNVV